MATMYPERTCSDFTNSCAEWRFYEACREQLPDHVVVLHGGRYLIRDPERWDDDGEIDFLIIDPNRGYLVVEVKSGRIATDGGKWYRIDRNGRRHRMKRSPFEQVMKRKHGLIREFQKAGISTKRARVCYAVCLPDCRVESDLSLEAPREAIIDSEDLRDLPAAVERCFGGPKARAFVPPQTIQRIQELFFPRREVPRARLGVLIEQNQREIVRLTGEQLVILDGLSQHPRVVVTGCAGSGKTFLALEQTRRLARAGYKVLYLCAGQPLAEWLREYVDHHLELSEEETQRVIVSDWPDACVGFAKLAGVLQEEIDPSTGLITFRYHADLPLDPCSVPALRAFTLGREFAEVLPTKDDPELSFPASLHDSLTLSPKISPQLFEAWLADLLHHAATRLPWKVDALIVDEAHRLPSVLWGSLRRLVADERRSPVWAFADDNRLVEEVVPLPAEPDSPEEKADSRDLSWMRTLEHELGQFMRFRLSGCYRNTRGIQQYALRYYLGRGLVRMLGPDGPAPELVPLDEREDVRSAVDSVVSRLVREEGVRPSHIVVLTPLDKERSALGHEWTGSFSQLRYRWTSVSGKSDRNTVRLASIQDFRGLESPAVILVELERAEEADFGLQEDEMGLLYLGLSRASNVLVIVGQPPVDEPDLGELARLLWQHWTDPWGLPASVRPRAEDVLRKAFRLLLQWQALGGRNLDAPIDEREIDLQQPPPPMIGVFTWIPIDPDEGRFLLKPVLEPRMLRGDLPTELEGGIAPSDWYDFAREVREVGDEIRQILFGYDDTGLLSN